MSYPAMLFGAFSSAILATLATAVLLGRTRRQPLLLLTTALSAFTGPLAWNWILRATGATEAFSHDIPFRPFPISWQDTGSGVFALAVAFTALSLGAGARAPACQAARLAAIVALAALLVDVYLY